MENKNALERIYKNLIDGHTYGNYIKGCQGELYYPCLSYVKNCFCYSHFGSSAVQKTPQNLLWLIFTIFETTPCEFERKYVMK